MRRVEKTVFLSYRRSNVGWALAIFQDLTHQGYDVFFDFKGIASGDFEEIILENIRARAHFIVLLTPSALERCNESGDWLRREIEEALKTQRNIVPLMLEGFAFATPSIGHQLTGELAALKKYNALRVPADFFEEAMKRLREKFLNVPLDSVLHPASASAQRAAKLQQAAAVAAPAVAQEQLTAEEWFEQGINALDHDEKIRCYNEAIRLKPDYADAFLNRGVARRDKGDLDGAIADYDEGIRLKPDDANAFYIRGIERESKGDLDGAIADYDEAIRLKPDYANAFVTRGIARDSKGNLDGAIADYDEAIRLKPDYATAFYIRGDARQRKGDLSNIKNAVADLQKYLDLGGGVRDGDQAEVEQRIIELQKKL
jgi:tetratricopeptide (TPR) repeat protein